MGATRKATGPAGTRRRATTGKDGYRPLPVDTSGVDLPPGIEALAERLSRNTHENWSLQRLSDGWRWGPERNDAKLEHPCLVPYDELPETEKAYDRRTALETLRLILALGWGIVTPPGGARPGRAAARRPAASPSPSPRGCARRTRS